MGGAKRKRRKPGPGERLPRVVRCLACGGTFEVKTVQEMTVPYCQRCLVLKTGKPGR